jgi:hypothetical protein
LLILCFGGLCADCLPFFHNEATDESVWNHPDEDKYIRMVKDERKYLEEDRKAEKSKAKGSSKNKAYDDGHDRRDDYPYDDGNNNDKKKHDTRAKNDTYDDSTKLDAYEDDYDDYHGNHHDGKHKNDSTKYEYDDYDDYGESPEKGGSGRDAKNKKSKNYDNYDDDYDRGRGRNRAIDNGNDDRYDDRNDKHYDDKFEKDKKKSARNNHSHYNDDYDDPDDDYDPDAELAKLNTSWGSGQYEKEKKTTREEAGDEVMMLDVEEFTDDVNASGLDFMPTSAKATSHPTSTSTSRKQTGINAEIEEVKEVKKKTGGNAIFGDHWLEDDDDDKTPDPLASKSNLDDDPWGSEKHSTSRAKTTSKDYGHSKSQYNDKGGPGYDKYNREDIHSSSPPSQRGDGRDRQGGGDKWSPERERGRDRDRVREQEHASGSHSHSQSSKYDSDRDRRDSSSGGAGSTAAAAAARRDTDRAGKGVVDNWGIDQGGRDRLQEERRAVNSSHWGSSTGGGGGTESSRPPDDGWDSKPKSKEVASSRRDADTESNDWQPKRNTYDDRVAKSQSPIKRNSATTSVDQYSKNIDRDFGRDLDPHPSEAVSPHVQAGVCDTLRAEVARLQRQLEDQRAQHAGDLRELDATTQSLRSSLQVGGWVSRGSSSYATVHSCPPSRSED